jgi:hypothetical protein
MRPGVQTGNLDKPDPSREPATPFDLQERGLAL